MGKLNMIMEYMKVKSLNIKGKGNGIIKFSDNYILKKRWKND